MCAELRKPSATWWRRWRLSFLAFTLTLCIALLGSRLLPRKCHHVTEVQGLTRYQSSIDLSKCSAKERAFLQAVMDGQVLGEDKTSLERILPKPRWFDLSDKTESLTFFVPNNHNGIPETSELWLTIDFEVECGHVAGAKFWDRPVH